MNLLNKYLSTNNTDTDKHTTNEINRTKTTNKKNKTKNQETNITIRNKHQPTTKTTRQDEKDENDGLTSRKRHLHFNHQGQPISNEKSDDKSNQERKNQSNQQVERTGETHLSDEQQTSQPTNLTDDDAHDGKKQRTIVSTKNNKRRQTNYHTGEQTTAVGTKQESLHTKERYQSERGNEENRVEISTMATTREENRHQATRQNNQLI